MQDCTVDIEKMTTPGERLKYIRERLVKLSRAEIQEKHGLSQDTLAAWENGKIKITEKGIERCIKIYNAENLIFSKEWLLTGEGLNPNFSFELNRYFKTFPSEWESPQIDDHFLIAKEIEYFRSLTPNSVTALISSDDMLPLYSPGDYVGGRLKNQKELEDCVGKDCIIKTKDQATYIRRLAKGKDKKHFNLVCINPHWKGNAEPVIYNVEIQSAAPIIWHRRTDD